MGENDHGYCEESMDKLLILSQVKHAKWGKNIEKGAKTRFSRLWLPLDTRLLVVNYERKQGGLLHYFLSGAAADPACARGNHR